MEAALEFPKEERQPAVPGSWAGPSPSPLSCFGPTPADLSLRLEGQPCKGGFLCWFPRGIPDVIGTCSWLAVQATQQVLHPHFIPIRYFKVGA